VEEHIADDIGLELLPYPLHDIELRTVKRQERINFISDTNK
jgi:hypothetical protein